MIDGIRIYYESLEQAHHMISPILERILSILDLSVQINLIKISNYSDALKYGKNIAPILFSKNPDILITVLEKEIEYPIIFMEFSSAVFTEDHELQRFDGLIAAASNNCVFVKISSLKKDSDNKFGGNTKFNPMNQYALIYKLFKIPIFHIDWESSPENHILVHQSFKSIPQETDKFYKLLFLVFKIIHSQSCINWINIFQKKASSDDDFKDWMNKLENFQLEELKTKKSPRVKWKFDPFLNEEILELKFNRFGHAMDPERGMLSFYATRYNNSKIVSKIQLGYKPICCIDDIPGKDDTKLIRFLARMQILQNRHNNKYYTKKYQNKIEISSQDSTKTITIKLDSVSSKADVLIDGSLHEITFTIIKKDGKYYLFGNEPDPWYKSMENITKNIQTYITKNGLKKPYDFLYCFALATKLISNQEFNDLIKKYESYNESSLVVDLTKFLGSNFNKLNRSLRTIFLYSKLFVLEDVDGLRKVIFKWENNNFKKSFDSCLPMTNIEKRMTLDEDDVTYISIHNILIPNGFDILAVSYPGAQGDRAILVAPGSGRRQERMFVDIIGISPNNVINLQENKKKLIIKEIQKDVKKLELFKNNKNYTEALKNFLLKYTSQVNIENSITIIGVGFWANKKFEITNIKNIRIDQLDYFIYITEDQKQWNIWSTGNKNYFTKTRGNVTIPITYAVK